jgi:hypothetical protein
VEAENLKQRLKILLDQAVAFQLKTVDSEIEALERLPPNWNGDDALPIRPQVIAEAKILLRLIADRALARGIAWCNPSVAPNPDGGIEFSWDSGERWVTIGSLPGQDSLECVIQEVGQPPVYRVALRVEAIDAALWAMDG